MTRYDNGLEPTARLQHVNDLVIIRLAWNQLQDHSMSTMRATREESEKQTISGFTSREGSTRGHAPLGVATRPLALHQGGVVPKLGAFRRRASSGAICVARIC